MNLFPTGNVDRYEFSGLQETVNRLEQLISRQKAEDELGNLVVGGPIRTQIAAAPYTSGPFREDLDASHPIGFDLWVPDYLLRIIRVQCRLKPVPIRNSLAVVESNDAASSGASSANTTQGGGDPTTGASSTSSSNSNAALDTSGPSATNTGANVGTQVVINTHWHRMWQFLGTADPGYSAKHYEARDGRSFYVQGEDAASYNTEDNSTVSTLTVASNGHVHDMQAHVHDITAHSHPIPHTHNTLSHIHPMAHTHLIEGHTHDTTLGITEGGEAQGLRLWIDGVDRSTALGGPWNAAAVFDITEYLLNVRREPVPGAHPIIIESTSVGAVEVWFDWLVIAKPMV